MKLDCIIQIRENGEGSFCELYQDVDLNFKVKMWHTEFPCIMGSGSKQ